MQSFSIRAIIKVYQGVYMTILAVPLTLLVLWLVVKIASIPFTLVIRALKGPQLVPIERQSQRSYNVGVLAGKAMRKFRN